MGLTVVQLLAGALALGVGFGLSFIRIQGLRRLLLAAWLLLPVEAFLALAAADGCLPSPAAAGEHCYWTGMGVLLLPVYALCWGVLALYGYRGIRTRRA